MGISLVPDEEHPNGEPGLWDAAATAVPTTEDHHRHLHAVHRRPTTTACSRATTCSRAWMAGEEPALGLTQNEYEEIPGPGMGGCPPSPDGQVPTPPTTAQLSSAVDSTSLTVAWQAPKQPG